MGAGSGCFITILFSLTKLIFLLAIFRLLGIDLLVLLTIKLCVIVLEMGTVTAVHGHSLATSERFVLVKKIFKVFFRAFIEKLS